MFVALSIRRERNNGDHQRWSSQAQSRLFTLLSNRRAMCMYASGAFVRGCNRSHGGIRIRIKILHLFPPLCEGNCPRGAPYSGSSPHKPREAGEYNITVSTVWYDRREIQWFLDGFPEVQPFKIFTDRNVSHKR
ncbi:hypothetical protein RRG08_061155 [Elysia crispata]|uniref:Uncharacterized protein n=1 Tax=Elysia crispata TaxID=231223 RepID=A0AAE0XE58_9GAST|nr:hypothetical protein RRG08_061155 [Elysia crispata]